MTLGGGGGIVNFGGGTVTLTNSTLTNNQVVAGDGGGISNRDGSTTLQHTILALNTATAGPECAGPITSFGNNLIGNRTDCTLTLQASDLEGAPGLDDFTDNGRPGTGHVPLLPGSPAIDAGNDAACPRRDQLGQRRVNIPRAGTSRCDIGAIEFPGKDHRPHKEKDDHHDKNLAAAARATP